MTANRYNSNPFLRLLDCFVLDAINMLDNNQLEILNRLEPGLSKTYDMQGTWREIVAAQMNFADTVPARIREFWEGYKGAAQQQGVPADPDEFVVSFVDQNFADMVADRSNN
ncbi:hypothetical protein [Acidovorax sp. 1608163]|uniref:hypothetical protein n=1 Tax=Acidovorax sp. 1608163 TaxID=2478662 RepID=UPI001F09FE2E|nr:hypothetical protein [Acidovorax sp. 1608163]